MTATAEWKLHWPLVTATAAGMALAAMLSSVFGVLLEPIEAETGWTRAEITTGPFAVSVIGLFLATPAGYLIDRLGAKLTGTITIAASFIAIMGMSMVGRELWHWWLVWGIFGIAGSFTSTVWMAPISSAFDKGRGMAIAITVAGASVSAATAPPMAEWFVQNYSWRAAFVALGILWCGLTLPLVLSFVPGRRRSDGSTDGGEGKACNAHSLTGLTPHEGLRSRNLYLIFFGSLISGLMGLALHLNLVPILTFNGILRTDAVMIVSVVGLTSIFGRLVAGWLMDKFDIRKLAIAGGVLSTVFPIVLLVAPGVVWIAMAALIFHSFVGGLRSSAVIYMTAAYFGARSFGLFYGAISIAATIAQGLGPLVANYVYDVTQSYLPTLWAAIPGFLLTALCFVALGPRPDFTRPAGAD
ncbi:MAG: MFS transporter [Alphaproteobacteria bacterium]|nr:MFS transporter [Alphaproteobacteria bacterium]